MIEDLLLDGDRQAGAYRHETLRRLQNDDLFPFAATSAGGRPTGWRPAATRGLAMSLSGCGKPGPVREGSLEKN